MREFFKMFFASLLAMVIAGIVCFGLFIAGIAAIGTAFSDKENKKKKRVAKPLKQQVFESFEAGSKEKRALFRPF